MKDKTVRNSNHEQHTTVGIIIGGLVCDRYTYIGSSDYTVGLHSLRIYLVYIYI